MIYHQQLFAGIILSANPLTDSTGITESETVHYKAQAF